MQSSSEDEKIDTDALEKKLREKALLSMKARKESKESGGGGGKDSGGWEAKSSGRGRKDSSEDGSSSD